MSNLTLSRKVEKAFAVGYLPTALNITGLNIYEGHAKADAVATPNLIVYAEGSSQNPGFPVECGVRDVRLRCKFQIDSMVTSLTNVDLWKQKLELKMTDDLQSLQTALNKPVDPLAEDERVVKKIHFHYVEMTDDPSDVSETDWIEDMVFTVTVELLDS